MNVEQQGWGAITEGLGTPIRKLLEQRSGMSTCVMLASGQQILVHDVAWGRDVGDVWEHVTANCSPLVAGHDVHLFSCQKWPVYLIQKPARFLWNKSPARMSGEMSAPTGLPNWSRLKNRGRPHNPDARRGSNCGHLPGRKPLWRAGSRHARTLSTVLAGVLVLAFQRSRTPQAKDIR